MEEELFELNSDSGRDAPEAPLKSFLHAETSALARQGVYLGTSSWKYPGWLGQIYSENRYEWRGKFAETRFNRTCLQEYAESFPAVCVDAGYYAFPTEKYVGGMIEQVPEDFLFSFKVTDEITVKHFPKLKRFGPKAGQDNPHFLSSDLFIRSFLKPLRRFQKNIGLLIFEFSQFYHRDFEHGHEFAEALDRFFADLPRDDDWQYGVEMRNKNFLKPSYFEVLQKYNVAHIYNNWTRMPSVAEQLEMPAAMTADFAGARFLLTPGRKYQDAVDEFSPYERTQAPDAEARQAGSGLINRILRGAFTPLPASNQIRRRPSFLFINNRLEGNAINTVLAMIEGIKKSPEKESS